MKLRRWSLILALGGALAVAAPALAGPPGGSLFITDHEVNTTLPDWEKRLPKEARDTLVKQVDGWKIFLVAYLNKVAGSSEVNLVFYDLTGGQREQVNAFPVATKASAKILASSIEISEEQGFKAGHKYQVLVTRLIGGKEIVYAKTVLTLAVAH